ncbi:MAG: DUF4037 domain-containing protein [Eubacterium sp.]|nr:DUF4037 domain-containing protein [Eubacterium sp.]
MKGLELAEAFFAEKGLPMLQEKFPHLLDRITAGLVGEGSECLGFDDEISRDHDWGISFCMWLPEDLYNTEGPALAAAYNALDFNYEGFSARNVTAQGGGRTGVLETGNFYYRFIGLKEGPKTNMEWFYVQETSYATCTNGKLFYKSGSEFEKTRQRLLDFYPEDVRKKKIAARAVTMAQSGQYNYVRSLKRGEHVAVFLSMGEFIKAACSMIHLLNRRYMPFYKWAYRSTCQCPKLADTARKMENLIERPLDPKNAELVEEICIDVKNELKRQGLTRLDYDFLEPHGMEIMSTIGDPRVRSLPVLYG